MDENIGYNGAYSGAEIDAAIGAVKNKETTWDGKQDKLTGVQGQVVGFDDEGDAVAMPAPDTGVTTFNGRTGAVTPQAGDYTAAMVGARGDDWTPTAADVGAVPTNRTVNGKALSANITLNASDVGAATPADVNAAKPILRTATLTTSGWSGNSQTVTVNGVVANSSAQLIYVSPANKDSATAWGEAGVFCSAQGANSLTFVCDSTPSASINVNISIQEAQT